MSDKTEFAKAYLAWREALRFTDDSPEAFEEVQRLQQLDRRVRYLQGYFVDPTPREMQEILRGEHDADIENWERLCEEAMVNIDSVIPVTEEDIEDVPLD